MKFVWSFWQWPNNLRTRDPENLGVDTIFVLLCHTLSEKRWDFGNGGLNLHITPKSKRSRVSWWHHPDFWSAPLNEIRTSKNFVWTPNQGSPKKSGFYCRIVAKKTPNLHFMHLKIVQSIWQWPYQSHKPWKPRYIHKFSYFYLMSLVRYGQKMEFL